MNKLGGLYPALITPFNKELKVDYKALCSLVEWNIQKGVDGFYVNGSTGECHLLRIEERKEILNAVIDQAKGRVKVISHVGCIGTADSTELAQHSKEIGADAVSAIPPFYYKFSEEEIISHYEAIVEATQIPMIVYNFPAITGIDLTTNMLQRYTSNPLIVGVKHTSHDLYKLERMSQLRDNFTVFSGHDEVFLAGLVMGAGGAIGSTYNFMPDIFIDIKKKVDENNLAEAKTLQQNANAVIEALLKAGGFPGTKYLTKIVTGIDCGSCRQPFSEISDECKQLLDATAKKYLNI